MSCSNCGTPSCTCSNTCSSVTSTVPFYQQADVCKEDHSQKIYQAQFFFSVCPSSSWNVPLCGHTAVLNVPGLQGATVGSYLWHPNYGYYEITSLDSAKGQIGITNNCTEGNAAAGVQIPACTCFTVTVPPSEDVGPEGLACLSLDFTAPADGDCILITVTSLGTLQAGDEIQIGTGRYRVSEINSSTTITICNDGLGLVPGTAVIAVDANGNYQYCFTVIANCCSRIEEAFGGDLTPCSDFENLVLAESETSPAEAWVSQPPTTIITTDTVTIIFTNTSSCRSMQVVAHFEFYAAYLCDIGEQIDVEFKPQLSVDGGVFNNIIVYEQTSAPTTATGGIHENFSNAQIYTILPSTALTLAYKVIVTLGAITGAGAQESSGNVFSKLTMFGVAA